jgi:aminopeptidase YwaD
LRGCRDQAADSDWVVRTNPYEGGSDHVPFLRAGTAGILLWHFTDQHYHTDGDRLEMVSAETLWNVSVSAAVSAMTLTSVDAGIATYLVGEVEAAALARLAVEAKLSLEAVAQGGDPQEEKVILESWTGWYMEALAAMEELEAGGASASTTAAIDAARARVREVGDAYKESMTPTRSR